MKLDKTIFKAYDIRGIYPEQLNETVAYDLGKALATLIKRENPEIDKPKLIVSRDMRLSSPTLKEAVVKGITEMGADVIDIGLASTPTFYFAVGFENAQGGIQVSASHNPKEYNGFKMTRAKAVPISGDSGIQTLYQMIVEGDFEPNGQEGEISVQDNMDNELINHFLADVNIGEIKPFRIIADAANSMGATYLVPLFEKLPPKLNKINFDLDGTFPSHEADPLKEENLELLKKEVVKQGADFGFSTDGDGDRLFIVDETGETLAPEILRGILAQIVLKKHPGAPIGYDIRPGKITEDLILEAGGKPFVTRVGHSLIKEEMLKMDAPFSGESSGHFFYRTPYGSFDAPVKLIIDFLIWLSGHNKPLSQAIKPFKRYFHSGEINSEVEDKEAIMAKLKQVYAGAKEINELDGVSIYFDEFWFNVRPSNTEPKLRLNLEAVSKEVMEQKRDEVLAIIRGG